MLWLEGSVGSLISTSIAFTLMNHSNLNSGDFARQKKTVSRCKRALGDPGLSSN